MLIMNNRQIIFENIHHPGLIVVISASVLVSGSSMAWLVTGHDWPWARRAQTVTAESALINSEYKFKFF